MLAAALLGVAACGGDEQVVPSSAPTSAASSSSASTTASTSTSTTSADPGQATIPTDPTTLVSCDEFASNAILTTPSRWWTDPPEGWRVA